MAALSACSVTEYFTSDSYLDENQLDHLVTAQVPQSTQNATPRAVKAFAGTVLPGKSDSDFMFCLHSYNGFIIDRSRVY